MQPQHSFYKSMLNYIGMQFSKSPFTLCNIFFCCVLNVNGVFLTFCSLRNEGVNHSRREGEGRKGGEKKRTVRKAVRKEGRKEICIKGEFSWDCTLFPSDHFWRAHGKMEKICRSNSAMVRATAAESAEKYVWIAPA